MWQEKKKFLGLFWVSLITNSHTETISLFFSCRIVFDALSWGRCLFFRHILVVNFQTKNYTPKCVCHDVKWHHSLWPRAASSQSLLWQNLYNLHLQFLGGIQGETKAISSDRDFILNHYLCNHSSIIFVDTGWRKILQPCKKLPVGNVMSWKLLQV